MSTLSAEEVARALGVGRPAAVKLMLTGLAGPVTRRGAMSGAAAVDAEAVASLAVRPELPVPPEPALIVSLGPPTEVDEAWRRFIGWLEPDATMDDGRVWCDSDRLRAAAAWWRVPGLPPDQLIAVVAGFVVGGWTIVGVCERLKGGFSRFDLVDLPRAQQEELRRLRIPTRRGPTCWRIGPAT